MMDVAIGLVVNPKFNEPVLAVYTRTGDYEIRSLKHDWKSIGSGSLDSHDQAAYATGYPRSHTPSGLARGFKGKGFGTALYTSLCLGAYQASELRNIEDSDADAPGISSSEEQRSSEATEWWDRAVDIGLADRVEDEEEDVRGYEDLNVSSIEDCVSTYDDAEVTDVRDISVDVVIKRIAEVYPYTSADGSSLVPAVFHTNFRGPMYHGTIWRALSEDESLIDEVDADEIVAFDVRGLAQPALNLLLTLARYGGADEKALAGMFSRWELGLDPEEPIRQEMLPFKKNSSEARDVREAIAQAAEIRQRLPWNKLAALP